MKPGRFFEEILEIALAETPYFNEGEVGCKCGCGLRIVQPKLVWMLHQARYRANIPFYINSWVRCEAHNKAVGGVKNSSHLKGWAVDIAASDDKSRYIIIEALLDTGFPILKVYDSFVHASIDPHKLWEVFIL
jgi:hypothetical protein